jgi:hypothetical protein
MSAEKAQKRAKELDEKIKEKKKDLKELAKWKIFKRAKLAFQIAGLVIARESCELYVKAVEACMDSIPIDASPRVWGPLGALKTALIGLNAAEEIVDVGHNITDELKEIGEKIAKGLAKFDFFVINNAEFYGSIKALAGKAPFTLKVDATICEERVQFNFQFDWKDVKKTVKSIVDDCTSKLRSLFAKNKSKKTKHYHLQAEVLENLGEVKSFADYRKVMTPEFQGTMLARPYYRKTLYLVNRMVRLAVADNSGRAVLGSSFLPHPMWEMTATSEGFFTLTSTSTGKSLMVEGGKSTAGTAIVVGTTSNLPEKEWRLERSGRGFLLRNRLSGKYLGIPPASQDAILKKPFAGYPLELQDARTPSAAADFGIRGKGFSSKAFSQILGILFQSWDLVQDKDVRNGMLKHSDSNAFVTGEKGVLGFSKKKDADTAWELFPVDGDPLSPYVYVRHSQSGKVIRSCAFDQKAMVDAGSKNDPEGVLKARQPAFSLLDLGSLKDAIWRVVQVGDSNFALINVLSGNVLAGNLGILHQDSAYPDDPKATFHLWSLSK